MLLVHALETLVILNSFAETIQLLLYHPMSLLLQEEVLICNGTSPLLTMEIALLTSPTMLIYPLHK